MKSGDFCSGIRRNGSKMRYFNWELNLKLEQFCDRNLLTLPARAFQKLIKIKINLNFYFHTSKKYKNKNISYFSVFIRDRDGKGQDHKRNLTVNLLHMTAVIKPTEPQGLVSQLCVGSCDLIPSIQKKFSIRRRLKAIWDQLIILARLLLEVLILNSQR